MNVQGRSGAQQDQILQWKSGAAEVSSVLKAIGNERRLLILCYLAMNGEMSVGSLVEAIRLSQSALSQHLARMRADEIVTSRRDGQVIYYRIADPRIDALMTKLYALYCVTEESDFQPS